MERGYGFAVLNTQIAASLKFISKANGMYKRNY